MSKNPALLKEIRDNYDYAAAAWKDIREEGKMDMKYIAGDPWDPKERAARKEADRPIITADELSQYINQVINDVRQQKRGAKVNPKGNGANDKTAQLREDMVRGIEYESQAQAAYVSGFEGGLQRSYGFWKVITQFRDDEAPEGEMQQLWDQDIRIKRIPNPDTVLIDPDFKEADTSDKKFAFITDIIRKADFKEKYPGATIKDFTTEMQMEYPKWVQADTVQVAEYWKVKITYRKLLLIEAEEGAEPLSIYEDELPKGAKPKILKARKVPTRKVCQYITNGLEILETNEWAGKWIPIVAVLGKEMYIDTGSGAKRVLMSLIRLARDPYMLYCYYRTCQAELVGMTPKIPYMGYEGQFNTSTDWANINKVPTAYAEAKMFVDGSGNPLPLPRREAFEPPIASLEQGAEAARRAIQAAMGMTPLPTAAQRQNEKSGEALKKISQEQAQGTFHFIDNLDRALQFNGRIIDDLIPKVIDTAREVGLRKANESHEVVRVNDPEYINPKSKQPEHLKTDEGTHTVTISTGPSSESQRMEASDFLDTIISNIEALPLDPAIKAQFMALLIRLKNLGPLGDEMAELLNPLKDNDPAKMQASLQKLDGDNKKLNAYAQQLEAKVKEMEQKEQAKVLDNQFKMEIEKFKAETSLAQSEVLTKAQSMDERLTLVHDLMLKMHASAHERGMQAVEHSHEADQAAAAQAAALAAQPQPNTEQQPEA